MKVVGLITEYNPFHKGHAYHIAEAKRITGADYALVIMSGDFVQRGEPAIFDKRLRTQMALMNGADAVIELPSCYAISSGEYFAFGAVSLLTQLNMIDDLCFGSESADLSSMKKIANFLNHESPAYQQHLQENLRQGKTFPQAREAAMESCGFTVEELSVLTSPNNILGIEYCRALEHFKSSIKPVPILRKGSSYHSLDTSVDYCSATSIRKQIEESVPIKTILKALPDNFSDIFQGTIPPYLSLNDLSLLLNYKLLTTSIDQLIKYSDVTPDFANRIKNQLNNFTDYTTFLQQLKSKDTTYTRASRSLLHILLDLKQDTLDSYREDRWTYYARLLGFKKSSQPLLTKIKECSTIPLITKPTDVPLTDPAKTQLDYDTQCANLYETILSHKYNIPYTHEYSKRLVIL